jgi:mannose-6-phosphate isomerase-like protein (cupin superfamily)
METKMLPGEFEVAPDGSQIRPMLATTRGGLAHCVLPVGKTSLAVTHRSVEEIWYFMEGRGSMWCKEGEHEVTVDVEPGVCLTIPTGTRFQFRNEGDEPLAFLISTMPPWPGPEEAVKVDGHWPVHPAT